MEKNILQRSEELEKMKDEKCKLIKSLTSKLEKLEIRVSETNKQKIIYLNSFKCGNHIQQIKN